MGGGWGGVGWVRKVLGRWGGAPAIFSIAGLPSQLEEAPLAAQDLPSSPQDLPEYQNPNLLPPPPQDLPEYQNPALWELLLQCYRALGRLDDAVALYRRKMDQVDGDDPRCGSEV